MKPTFFSLLIAASNSVLPCAAQTQLTGDMNGDGRLTIDDVTLLVKAVMEYDSATDELDNGGKTYVDLGLTSGTLWATCNIGANTPEDYGDYFAWGETQTKTRYYPANYKYKGNSTGTLSLADDAAHVQWGGSWRMPTTAEISELYRECDWEWTSRGTSSGYVVKSRVRQTSIFLPAAGISTIDEVQGVNDRGIYWTNSISTGDADKAVCLDFTANRFDVSSSNNYEGASIRPVLSAKISR